MTESSEIKIIDLKGCSYCNEILPANRDHFNYNSNFTDKLSKICLKCPGKSI